VDIRKERKVLQAATAERAQQACEGFSAAKQRQRKERNSCGVCEQKRARSSRRQFVTLRMRTLRTAAHAIFSAQASPPYWQYVERRR